MPDSDVKDPGSLLRDGELRRLRGQPEWDNTDYNRDHSWWGFDRGQGSAYPPLHYRLAEEMDRKIAELIERPTHEERVERCELMGMVFCSCKLDNGIVVVYNPTCPVHQHFCKL